MPDVAAEATFPPSSRARERGCPRCRKPPSAFSDRLVSGSGLPRCPDHGLPFVDLRDASDPLLGTTIAGRFTILGRLGRGSMGAVYRARQETVGRDVALKLVRQDRAHDPETKGRFEREARAISALASPHTVTAFDFGEAEDGSWFLAMEMLEGETLGERLRRFGRLDWFDAVRFTRDALKSLAEAHGKGIIHRDLKPDNLFLSRVPSSLGGAPQESCKVLDFGIAKWSRNDDETQIDQLETQAGTVFGTPRYMSPEQAQGSPLDARSDLYSLGVLLYQMLSGRAPFVDDDAVVVMARHIKDPPPHFDSMTPAVDVPDSIAALLWRTLAKSPADRPASAEQMIAELDAAEISIRAVESGPRLSLAAPEITPAPRRNWLILAVGVVLLGIGLLLILTRGPRSSVKSDAAGVVSGVGTTQQQHRAPGDSEPAPPASVNSLENSSSPPAASLPVAPTGTPEKRVNHAHGSKPPLQKKGNERYGRFD